jgi:ferredoxin-thioredoxin reductase catalytic subunit/rhodanese-related sulfurtransferase
MNNIDINSEEFKLNLSKTIKFTDKVNNQFGWVYNPEKEINEGIQLGLTRNKITHGKRFCPCFMVDTTGDKPKSVDDRICPCKPAIEKEIPEKGVCHCQIFCTPEFAQQKINEHSLEEATHSHDRELTSKEINKLIDSGSIDGEELISLISARTNNITNFTLMDVREKMEYEFAHIEGTDILVPTSDFYDILDNALETKKIDKNIPIILYCQLGSRSEYVYDIMKGQGFIVVNLRHGYSGFKRLI